MPSSDSSDSQPPQKKPPRRDPRLDAKPPVPGQRPAAPLSKPQPLKASAPKPELSKAQSPIRSTPEPDGQVIDVDEIEILGGPAKPRRPSQRQVVAGIVGLAAVIIVTLVSFALFPGNAPEDADLQVDGKDSNAGEADRAPVSELRDPVKPVLCQIVTPEPGFIAFIDEQPVLDATGQPALTPCEVGLEKGEHVVRVEKHGWNDTPKTIQIREPMEIVQSPIDEPFNYQRTTFKAQYLTAAVGQPIPLQTLSVNGRCQDPFVSPDGREIWYAAAGPEGTGIYYSTRLSAYEEWEAPAILILSKGTLLPASPSAIDNGLVVAYTIPDSSGRIWSLLRKSAEGAFDEKADLRFSEQGEPNWPSAQLSANGKSLYWFEINGDKTFTWVAQRYEIDAPFGKGKKLSLPGGHPCLSADELRQYVFDGKQLKRARRATPEGRFAEPQVIAEVDLAGYEPHPERRQFWVSEDEQWLYYSLNPEQAGDLFVVRLHQGPARGVRMVGKTIPSKKAAVLVQTEAPEMTEDASLAMNADDSDPTGDPKSLATPYAEFQQQLVALLAKRDVSAAAKLIQERSGAPELQDSQDVIAWDKSEVEAIQAVWDAADAAAQELKPGDSIRVGSGKFTFDGYADGIFQLTASSKKVERKLRELTPGDVLALAEKKLDKSLPETQLMTGIFLSFEGKSQVQPSQVRLEKAGSAGEEFQERLAARRLRIIEQELARRNLSSALQQIDSLIAAFPKSPSSATADKHRQDIYSFVKWKEIGERDWERGEASSYIAQPQKKPGSFLLSEQEYAGFDLSLEWRTTTPTGQGGIYFRYNGIGKPLEAAFKIHIANDAGVKPDKFCTGSVFNINPPTENLAKPMGQWNTLKMQVRGERVLVVINGKKVQESLATDAAVPLQGLVALDGEFGGIEYRKILLVEATSANKNP